MSDFMPNEAATVGGERVINLMPCHGLIRGRIAAGKDANGGIVYRVLHWLPSGRLTEACETEYDLVLPAGWPV